MCYLSLIGVKTLKAYALLKVGVLRLRSLPEMEKDKNKLG
jgi:hypothetical protein